MINRRTARLGMACLAVAVDAHADLYFSEYVEGSGNNKALEIYNSGPNPVDLAGHRIEMYFNGNTNAGFTINLSSILPAGGVYVVAPNVAPPNSAAAEILAVANQTVGTAWFNGDDAIVLRQGTTIIDSIGQVGFDPGTEWGTGLTSTADNTLRRKASVTTGDTNPFDVFDPAVEWDGYPINTFDGLGSYGGSNGGGNNGGTMDSCGSQFTAINLIQGSGDQSPLLGTVIQTEGVVTAVYQNAGALGGFFMQTPDASIDESSATSEGIFVASSQTVVAGNALRVMGTVSEQFGLTQISATSLTVCAPQQPLPQAKVISLPVNSLAELEALEGMRVTAGQTWTVNETYQLGRFGQVLLANGRLFQPTHSALPGAPAAAIAAQNALNQILLDDGSNVQNPDPVIFPAPALSANNTLRSGDSVVSLTGVLSYDFGAYRILPTTTPVFVQTNLREAATPDFVDENLRVGSFNVLNYFNGDGLGGGFPTPRGANSAAEFARQKVKILSALAGLKADIVGLIEIENDGYGSNSAIAELVRDLNAHTGQDWQFINPGVPQIGTDEIAVGFIYRTSKVRPVGQPAILTTAIDPRFIDTKNRPVLAASFQLIATGGVMTVAVNHLKSKGSACNDVGDPDLLDGQGNCPKTRESAASALVDWLAAGPTGIADNDRMIIGDLNSYAQEDAIRVIKEAGYIDLLWDRIGADAYSYVFNGQAGYLDYALATPSLNNQIRGIYEWHINADEPLALDYNLEFKSPGQQASFYAPDPYRSSDHDPLVVSLKLIADLDGDGDVDKYDVKIVTDARNTRVSGFDPRDINADGVINLTDSRLLALQCTRVNCAP